MNIVDMLAPLGSTVRKGKEMINCVGVTIHNTGNSSPGAGALNHAKYLRGDGQYRVPGWHYAVDDEIAACSIPDGEIAEHTGTRQGNDTTLGIEICMNPDSDIRKATDNAAELTAMKLSAMGYNMAVWKENLFQHNDWSGKDCPSQIRRGIPYDWSTFVSKVNGHMKGSTWQPPTFVITHLLKKGMDDAEVIHITRNLKALGYTERKTSIFDADIERVVMEFQKEHGLTADGIVGRQTTEALGGKWDPNYVAPPEINPPTEEPDEPKKGPLVIDRLTEEEKKRALIEDGAQRENN